MKVRMLAYTHISVEGLDYIDDIDPDWIDKATNDVEVIPEVAARTCYASQKGIFTNPRFIPATIKRGHESVLEHASVTFLIEGISTTCLGQLTRHRLASYSVQSQRYVKQDLDECVVPPSIQENKEAFLAFTKAWSAGQVAYEELLAMGIKKEDARFVLPRAVGTNLVMTANLREWRHILKMRLHSSAQWEIRMLANEIWRILSGIAPSVVEDLAPLVDAKFKGEIVR